MDLHISLIGRKDLSGEIYRQIRQAILEGRLRPRDALPPTRELARRLNVSRMTVTVAYERLAAEGFVAGRPGSGTYVSQHIEPARPKHASVRGHDVLQPKSIWNTVALPTAFAHTAAFDFRTGLADALLFPVRTWRRLVARELRSDSLGGGVYGHPGGHLGLREAIARHIGMSRGLRVSAEDITITNGTQQAIDIVARTLLGPGDTVAVEDPGYQPPRRLFTSLGLRVVGVPVDRDGLMVDAIPQQARLVYVTPSHQYPLGVPMTLARRMALLAWAERNNAAIIEDDYDSEFRFSGRPTEPLHTIDARGRVIYVGSFSKTMLPTLRLGFLVAPQSLRAAAQCAKFVTDWHTPLLIQAAMARFIDDGGFSRHVRRMNNVYRERHELLTNTLTRDFADQLELIPCTNGLHVAAAARFASVDQIDACVDRAYEAGVAVQKLSTFAAGTRAMAGFVLGYGAIARHDIEEGLRRLRHCLVAVTAAARPAPRKTKSAVRV